jgi:hypothetical protein
VHRRTPRRHRTRALTLQRRTGNHRRARRPRRLPTLSNRSRIRRRTRARRRTRRNHLLLDLYTRCARATHPMAHSSLPDIRIHVYAERG